MSTKKETTIQEFYNEKTIFLTGGTGFLGKVLIEKILRVTEVERIYILIRPKKGTDIDKRVKDLLKDPLFDKLHELKPNARNRLETICGDVAAINLGLSNDDRATLIEKTDIVIHSAATVRFNEHLSSAIKTNVRGTVEMLRLAKMMNKLKAFVHVSTVFANCSPQRTHIAEQFYLDKLPINSENACKLLETLEADMINRLSPEFCKGFANTYCLTKAIGEEAVQTHGTDLPICIFRPGIVTTTCADPIPGWIDNFNGAMGIWSGTISGFLRVLLLRWNTNAAMVPIDFCVSTLLALGWSTSRTHQLQTPIYNFVPEEGNLMSWGDFRAAGLLYNEARPLSRMLWFPFAFAVNSKLAYRLLCFFLHTTPAYAFDFLSYLTGKPERLSKIYSKIHTDSEFTKHFLLWNWTFETCNTNQLWSSLSLADQHLFNFDMKTLDWQQYVSDLHDGIRRFLFKDDPESIPSAKKLWKRLYLLHQTLKYLLFSGTMALTLWILHSALY